MESHWALEYTYETAEDFSLAEHIADGAVGVLPTDTLYGLVADAGNSAAVEHIFMLKQRMDDKPLIVLIPHVAALAVFNAQVTQSMREVLKTWWPGPVSIILPVHDPNGKFEHLHRGTSRIAFRVPDVPHDSPLMQILREVPLAAPSANREGEPPAQTITKARAAFGNEVDFYADAGYRTGPPSRLLLVHEDGRTEVLR